MKLATTTKKKKKNAEANKLVPKFKKIVRVLNTIELACTKTDGTKYDFNLFSHPLKLIENMKL